MLKVNLVINFGYSLSMAKPNKKEKYGMGGKCSELTEMAGKVLYFIEKWGVALQSPRKSF